MGPISAATCRSRPTSRRSGRIRGSAWSASSTKAVCCCSKSSEPEVAVASATGATQGHEGEVASFYRVLWAEAQTRRREIAIAVEAVMVIAWFLVRTVANVDSRIYLLWLLAA